MCGIPHRSRTIRTGAARPGIGARAGCVRHERRPRGRAGRRQAAPAASSAIRERRADASSRLRMMTIKDGLLADYDHEIGTTRRLLERLPDDKFSWKPHPKSMSLGGLATHLANLPHWGGAILNDASFDLAAAPPNLADRTSRADILAAFDQVSRETRGWMDRTDAEFSRCGRSSGPGSRFSRYPGRSLSQLRAAPHHPSPGPAERVSFA